MIFNRSHIGVSSSCTDHAIRETLMAIDSPRSLAVWLLYKEGEHSQLVQLECNPLNYNDPGAFRDDYLATCLLSKAVFLRTGVNTRTVALEKFLESEKLCAETNRRLSPFLPGGFCPPADLHPLIMRVRSKIARILGPFDFDEVITGSGWGPGVSTLIKGEMSVSPNKYQHETGMTQGVLNVVWPLIPEVYPSWWGEILSKLKPTVQRGNVLTTVPKNAKTDRVIAVEPGWNLWFQKGIGSAIRRRLLRFGCNLNDQGINASLAKEAYSQRLATVDFSSASDTISRAVCELLLPADWLSAMELFRSHYGDLDGKSIFYEKFSSMGNGFTFELESLIFLACARACVPPLESHKVSVYGDDVILPAEWAASFTELVEILGFRINKSKSFFSGLFYESCGSHYFRGSDVKPFFLKRPLKEAPDLFLFHNNLMDYAHRCCLSVALDRRFKRTLLKLRGLVSPFASFFVPRVFGTAGFSVNLCDAMNRTSVRFSRHLGWQVPALVTESVTVPFDGFGLLLDRLRVAGTSGSGGILDNRVPVKGRVKYRSARLRVPDGQWYDFGGWA